MVVPYHPGMATVAGQPASSPLLQPNEAELIDIVERAIHASPTEWLFFRELRVGTGRQNGSTAARCLRSEHPAAHRDEACLLRSEKRRAATFFRSM